MKRLEHMYELRQQAAEFYRELGLARQTPNGDEREFPDLRGSFSKGLPHDAQTGLVDVHAFHHFFNHLTEIVPAPAARSPFVDPQAGFAFDTEGPDAHQFAMPPAPKFNSDLEIAEIAENYWMALLRDVPFAAYPSHPLAQQAATHLDRFEFYSGVTAGTLFRGLWEGDEIGPYLSQFLIWDVPYGAQKTPNQIAFGLKDNTDYLTNWDTYLAAQNGVAISPGVVPVTPRYMTAGREVSQYVHVDELFQAYLNACLILISPASRGGFGALAGAGNPYVGADTSVQPPVPKHMSQVGFGTLGEPNFKTLVAEISTRALKQVWHQKWMVHRRLRPEAFGGCLEAQRTGAVQDFVSERHIQKLQPVLDAVQRKYGTWLLPQAFPEGCPLHPSYGAGHATVAGACVTILKALFYTDSKLTDLNIEPLMIDAAGNRVPYTGADMGEMTILGELNKLASNIGLSRNIAGVHWRTDYTESIYLGEQIALHFLQDTIRCYREDVTFQITTFSGNKVTIYKDGRQRFNDQTTAFATT